MVGGCEESEWTNKRTDEMAQHPIIRRLESRMRCLSKMEIIKSRSQPFAGRTLHAKSVPKSTTWSSWHLSPCFSSNGIGGSTPTLIFFFFFPSLFFFLFILLVLIFYFVCGSLSLSLCVCLCIYMCVWKAINRHGFQQINHPRSVNGKSARVNPLTFLYRVFIFFFTYLYSNSGQEIRAKRHTRLFFNCNLK